MSKEKYTIPKSSLYISLGLLTITISFFLPGVLFDKIFASTNNSIPTLSLDNMSSQLDTNNSAMIPTNTVDTTTNISTIFTSDVNSTIENNQALVNNSATGLSNNLQLDGTEKVEISAKFKSKPLGLATDYSIIGKPQIKINGETFEYQYLNDTNDEITVSDIMMSLRATGKLNNASDTDLPLEIRVFSNPVNSTENTNNSQTIMNEPNRVENIEIGGVIYPEILTIVKLFENGTGILNSRN